MRPSASADFETRCDVDIKTHSASQYFASPHWRALILCYQIDGQPVRDWTDGPCPEDLADHIRSGGAIQAFNAAFERRCFDNLAEREGWPTVHPEQFRCTQAQAAALGLPRKLETLGDALGLAVKKDKRGAALIRKFSVPRKARAGECAAGPLWNEPEDHPEDFAAFVSYCRDDVLTEAEAGRRMVPLSDAEQAIYQMSERINDRGLRIDRTSCEAAIRLVAKAEAQLNERMRKITGGIGFGQVEKLRGWLAEQGVYLAGAAKDDILEALDLEDLPDNVREALLIRQEAAKTSTRKLKAFLKRADPDDRIRGVFVYHGASPGRFSSAGGINVNNLPRPSREFEDAEVDLAALHRAFRSEDPALVRALYGENLGRPTHLVSDALRTFIWAAPGHDLIAVDYSGIQGALTAWLAGEEWKLQAMREIIADPSLPDLYRRAAAGILNTTTDVVTKKHWARQLDKVSELALSFAGGPSALVSMAANYALRRRQLHDLFPGVWEAASVEARESAEKRYERALRSRKKSSADVLSREAWLMCSVVVAAWRAQNRAHGDLWRDYENATRDAVREPGRTFRAGRIDHLVSHGFLWRRLPSGRCVAYASPRLKDQVWARFRLPDLSWSEAEVADRDEAERLEIVGKAKIEGKTSAKVTALGVDSQTQKLTRYALYGGLATENCLGADTLVLTKRGWRTIICVKPFDILWDGNQWVRHNGVVCRGLQDVIDFDGIRATPDHKFWTGASWETAERADIYQTAAASPLPKSHRQEVRSTDSRFLRRWRRLQKLVERTLQMRDGKINYRNGANKAEKQIEKLWVFAKRACSQEVANARHDPTSSLLGVAEHGGSMPSADQPRLQKLWRTRYFCLRTMEKIREFLERYGADLAKRSVSRSTGQQQGIFAEQLCMAHASRAEPKSSSQRLYGHSAWSNAHLRSCGNERLIRRMLDASTTKRDPSAIHFRTSTRAESKVLVFDIINAGPDHRFTVKGRDGRSHIASNCAMGIEADILRLGLVACEKAGYSVVLHAYDEAVAEVPRGFGSLEEMTALMLKLPDWAAGLPLAATGWSGKRYRK